MTGILDLPTEILLDIIDLVLLNSRIEIPKNTKRKNLGYFAYYIQDEAAYKPNALPLLLACRTMHEHAKRCVRNAPRIMKVDVEMFDGCDLFPTWRFIPRNGKSAILDRIEINLTLWRSHRPWSRGFRLDDGSQTRLIMEIFRPLFVFGSFTPERLNSLLDSTYNDVELPLVLYARTLVFNVDTHKLDTSIEVLPGYDNFLLGRKETCRMYPVDPADVVTFMNGLGTDMGCCLGHPLDCRDTRFNTKLFRWVERYLYCVDGSVVKEICVADYKPNVCICHRCIPW